MRKIPCVRLPLPIVRIRLGLLILGSCLACPAVLRAHDDPTLVPPRVSEAPPIGRPEAAADPRAVRVLLMLMLDAAGEVAGARVLEVEPAEVDAVFAQAALAYVRKLRFEPARRGKETLASRVRFEVRFPAQQGADAQAGVPSDDRPAPGQAAAPLAPPAIRELGPGDGHHHPPGQAGEHVHAHLHTVAHRHAHDRDEAHEEGHFGAVAQVGRLDRAASSTLLDRGDLPQGAHVLPADLLRAVPGVFVVQHAGGGKANQYFLRGFDADHGTDIALSFDGVPVNMVSHGHGQGYADLSWIIPELVAGVAVRKGPYDPRDGDFATAGAIDFQTERALPQRRVTVEAGSFHRYRALMLLGSAWRGLKLTGAAELAGTDGPFARPEDLQRVNLFARGAGTLAGGELSLTVTGYLGGWNASGQIPQRAVRAGSLDRFGFVDGDEGGNATRHNLYVRYRSASDRRERWDLLGYVTLYRFSLYSNFTFFRDDPVSGDMIHQRDRRTLSGFKVLYARDDRLARVSFRSRAGFALRHDRIANGLEHAPRREAAEPWVQASIEETSVGAYAEEEIEWTPWLRTGGGLRADLFGFAVRDALEDRASEGTQTSGEARAHQLSPKASVVVTPLSWLNLHGNFGVGFHSNDARGVLNGVTPLTRATGYEVGVVVRAFDRLRLGCALFRLDLDSELVWVGDEGTTEASAQTRRDGIEADLRVWLFAWLWADASLTLARPRFVGVPASEREVPLAPRRFLTAGITAAHPKGPFGRLSMVMLGDRPATEDGALTAQGFTRLDLSAGYRSRWFEVALALENLLNTRWRESLFANVSRLRDENAASACRYGSRPAFDDGAFLGCEDVHFTPGAPFAVRASASVFF